MISSINSNVTSYTSGIKSNIPKTNQSSQAPRVDPNSAEYKAKDKSRLEPSLRDRLVDQINRTSGDSEAAENLLSSYSKPDSGGLLLAGVPDLNNPQAMAREARVTSLFNSEHADFEKQKSDMISSARANGESAEAILNDLIELYDSQSDLLKTGMGWDGDVFAFDSSSPEGLARTQRYIGNPINVRA